MVAVSAIWALDDFTETNGATELIPESHRWGPAECAAVSERDAVMPAGSAVLFAGTLLHRGGAHRAAGPGSASHRSYCEGWVRQIENLTLAVPPELARNYSERVQALLGYDIFEPTFIGYVDGMHPKRLLGPEYAATKQGRTKVVLPH
jgi:ectoine hydroxylase-related dioxygenase (phytanoyl-CoA dioxygenase family)